MGSFLTPDMASKKDARHGIGLTQHRMIECQLPCLASLFDAMSGIKKLNFVPLIN